MWEDKFSPKRIFFPGRSFATGKKMLVIKSSKLDMLNQPRLDPANIAVEYFYGNESPLLSGEVKMTRTP